MSLIFMLTLIVKYIMIWATFFGMPEMFRQRAILLGEGLENFTTPSTR